jgi:hypothetical protein
MGTDRVIKRGESTCAEWLKECADLEKGYDELPPKDNGGTAALTGWPYDQPKVDMVNSPPHYQFGQYEIIDLAEAIFPDDPHLFQAFQYMARAKKKGQFVQDCEKAIWNLKRRIKVFKESNK